jgi:hypothetical protein
MQFGDRVLPGNNGKEIASTGTPHLQGYAELNIQMRHIRIKKNINSKMCFAAARTLKEAIEYCKKRWTVRGEGISEDSRQETGRFNRSPHTDTQRRKNKTTLKRVRFV